MNLEGLKSSVNFEPDLSVEAYVALANKSIHLMLETLPTVECTSQ